MCPGIRNLVAEFRHCWFFLPWRSRTTGYFLMLQMRIVGILMIGRRSTIHLEDGLSADDLGAWGGAFLRRFLHCVIRRSKDLAFKYECLLSWLITTIFNIWWFRFRTLIFRIWPVGSLIILRRILGFWKWFQLLRVILLSWILYHIDRIYNDYGNKQRMFKIIIKMQINTV